MLASKIAENISRRANVENSGRRRLIRGTGWPIPQGLPEGAELQHGNIEDADGEQQGHLWQPGDAQEEGHSERAQCARQEGVGGAFARQLRHATVGTAGVKDDDGTGRAATPWPRHTAHLGGGGSRNIGV